MNENVTKCELLLRLTYIIHIYISIPPTVSSDANVMLENVLPPT